MFNVAVLQAVERSQSFNVIVCILAGNMPCSLHQIRRD